MPTRRQFMQWAGAGAAASLATKNGFAAKNTEKSDKKNIECTFRLGLASYSTRKLSLDETLKIANRLGLKYLCLKSYHLPLDGTPKQIAKVVAKVKAAGIDLYGCGVITMRKPADVDRAFEYAGASGMKVIVCMPSVELLPLMDEKVRQYDICAAIHNHGPEDKVFPTPDVAYEKIKHLDHRIGLCIDIGHTIRGGVDPSRAAEEFADRLIDVHINDITSTEDSWKAAEVGRGVIDIPKFLRTLVKIRYSGVVSFEYVKDPDAPLPGLAESVGYVRGVLATI